MNTFRATALGLLAVGACDQRPTQPAPESTSVRAPGAVPTHELSFDLVGRGPEERLAILKQIIVESKNPCAVALQATLEGGVDGTDEWTLICSDRAWTIWLKPASNPIVEPREVG